MSFSSRKPDGDETDSPMPDAGGSTKLPMGKIGSLPGIPEKKKAILKARSREPSKSRAQSRGRTKEPEGGSQRSRSRGEERKKPVGVLPSGYFTRVSAQREEAEDLNRQEDIMPSDFTNPALLGDFLDWTVRDLSRSWSDGERAWFNMYVGLYLYEPWHWSTCHPRCFAACSVSRDQSIG